MMLLPLQPLAQASIERLLNSLPEGILIALFAWTLLKFSPRQNSRTRFAVWFLALVAVAFIPFISGLTFWGSPATSRPTFESTPSAFNLPEHSIPFIFLIWFVPVLIGVVRLAAGLWHLHALRSDCAPLDGTALDPSLARTINELNRTKSIALRPVTVATSDRIRVPAALGLWKPMIVLPAWTLREMSPSDLSIILRHEFAHLRRWDDWTNLAQKFVRTLFFFHPAVWWIESHLSVEREMACDDIVVAETANPMGYASCLVSLLERSLAERRWAMAQAIVHRAREASERLARILDQNRPAADGFSKPAIVFVGAFTLLCLFAIPRAPELVAFDRAPQPTTADRQYSAALVHAPMVPASLVERAAVQHTGAGRAGASESAPIRGRAALQGRVNAPSSEGALDRAADASNRAAQQQAAMAQNVNRRSASGAAVSPAWQPQILPLTLTDFVDNNAQPTLVFFQATEFIEPDSQTHYMVWHIQILRLTLVNPVHWNEQVPIARSI